MSKLFARRLALAGLALTFMGGALAHAATGDPVYKPVTSLARVVSMRSAPPSDMQLRLKLVPRMSYAMQTFKVTDRSQLEGLSEGSWVRFTSKRQDGVQLLDHVEPVPECKRMAVCGPTRTSLAAPTAG